jgi:hypothetical protein
MTGKIPQHHRQRGALAGKLVAIFACGAVGGVAAWSIVTVLEWDGAGGAIVAAMIAMVISVVLWAADVAALQSMGRRR